jgi:ADP-ribose pyrophosphatase YjhB (NUDIX family)
MMGRIEHYNDPEAPRPNRLVPAASAVVADSEGRILLARRRDNDLWTIPGGAMEPGETIAQCAVREVKEETGVDVEVVALVGIYSNPNHVVEYSDGEVRQQFSICFACRPTGGTPAGSDETSEVAYFTSDEIVGLEVHPSIRLRIAHYLSGRTEPFIG